MPNGPSAAGVRLAVSILLLTWSVALMRAQSPFGNPYDASMGLRLPLGYPPVNPWGLRPDFDPDVQTPVQSAPAGTISSDVLRNPISSKALHALEKALHNAEM